MLKGLQRRCGEDKVSSIDRTTPIQLGPNEFKDKITEPNRRRSMNDLGGYSGWEVATDHQQLTFSLNLVPKGFPDMRAQ